MPALTASQISQQLGQYIEPGGDFLAALNQALPRIYSMGFWRDTVYEIQLDAGNGYVSLPEDTESVLSATVDNLPAQCGICGTTFARSAGRNRFPGSMV